MQRRDRGSMTVIMVLVSATLVAATALAAGPMFRVLAERQAAVSAADAAALAGVVSGRQGAESAASRNGAELVGWSRDGAVVWVQVRLGRASATARATDGP